MKKVAILMLAVLTLTACQKEEGDQSSTAGLVTIDPVITRATEVNFEEGDKIGLTITKEDETVYAENSLLIFTGNVFAGNLEWYAEANDPANLVAYYPYSTEGAPTSFTVVADQTNGYSSSDLMGAGKTGVLPTVNSISMVFKHMLTKIVIKVENESGSDISSITLQGSIPTAKVDWSDLSVEVDATQTATDITAQQVTANTTYQAIVVPQTVAFTLVVKTANGKTLSQKLTSADLANGGQYTVNARVMADEVYVSLSGEIENWTDEGTIGADGSGDEEPDFEEGDGYFIYDGVKYNTVTFSNGTTWMAEPLRYIPTGYTPSADPTTDSHIWYPYEVESGAAVAKTDESTIAKKGYLYDLYVALGGKEITPENLYTFEGNQGICPKGWHIPTRAEYLSLVASSTKNHDESIAPDPDPTAIFYDAGYKAGKITKANEAGFNYVFAGARMQSTFTNTPAYQATVATAANCEVEEWIGLLSLNHYLTSTAYQASYNNSQDPTLLTNIQFFAMMSTFAGSYKEGRLSLAYFGIKSGAQLRCIKDNN